MSIYPSYAGHRMAYHLDGTEVYGIATTESKDAYEYVTVNTQAADTTYKRGYGISKY